jgi:hypothetical protein
LDAKEGAIVNLSALRRKARDQQQRLGATAENLLYKRTALQTDDKRPLLNIEEELATGKTIEHFERVYEGAGLTDKKFSVTSLAKLVQTSRHLRSQSPQTKSTALLVALEAVNISVNDVMEDASQRERALDSYEAVQRQALEEFESRKDRINSELQAELDAKFAEINAKIQANQSQVSHVRTTFARWQAFKREEVERLRETIDLCRLPAQSDTDEQSLSLIKPGRRFSQEA